MVDFLDYGTRPKGTATPVDIDPRGKSSLEALEAVRQEKERRRSQEEAMEELAREKDFSLVGYTSRAISQESIAGNLFGMAEDFVQEYDPEFDPSPYIQEDWPEWRKDAVMEAKNEAHVDVLVNRTEEQYLYDLEGQYHGGMAMVAQVGAAFLNPETYVLGIGEAAALTKMGVSGARRIASGAAIGALGNVAQEAAIIANNKSRDELGLLYAAGFGAGFGAVGGLFPDLKGQRHIQDTERTLGADLSSAFKNDMNVATGDIQVPKTVIHRSPDAQAWEDAVNAGTAAIDPGTGKYVVTLGDTAAEYDSKALAAAAIKLRDKKVDVTPEAVAAQVDLDYGDLTAQYARDVKKRKGGWWSSITLEGLSSDNPWTRKLHSILVEDASGTGGKQVATHSAALKAHKNAYQLRSLWHVARTNGLREWGREQGQQGLKRWLPWDTSAVDSFDDAVIREMGFRRNPKSKPRGFESPKSVRDAADAYENFQTARFSMLKDSGVRGYADIDPDPLHIPHRWDGIALTRASQQHSKGFVIKLLQKAILNGGEFDRAHKYAKLGDRLDDAFKERTAFHMANAIYNRFTRRPDTVNMARAGYLTRRDLTELQRRAEALIENPEDLKHLMAATDPKDSRLANDTLSQIDMDINFEVEGVAVRDFLDTNLGSSMDTEIRRTAGKAAMADAGFADQSDFLEFCENAGRWSRENTKLNQRELEKLNEKNQKLWNLLMGENLERQADAALANTARGFRKAATLVSLNQVGFAQAAEMGRLTGAIGIRGMLKQVPEFRNMLRNMRRGTFKDPMLNDIEAAFEVRIGDNEILNHPALLAESGGLGITKDESKRFLNHMDTVANKALHVQGYINGMNYMMKLQHRMHARGFFMRLADDLTAGKPIPERRARRYADIGLSQEDLRLAKAEVDVKSEFTTGWFGQNRLQNMNLVQFDPGIREKLALAFHKNQSQAIQRNLGGETAWWMENSLGKLLSQFRSFPLVAIEKQTLHDLKHLDVEALVTAGASMGFAALAYSAKTYANSFGLPSKKRKQYLKNRLSPEKVAAGAASWAGQLSIAPDIMSTAGDFGIDNPFAWTHQKGMAYRRHHREQGLDLSAIGAVGGMADAAYRLATGVGQSVMNGEMLRDSTLRQATRIAPFGNSIPFKIGANAFLNK
jgi:hypothetical protein